MATADRDTPWILGYPRWRAPPRADKTKHTTRWTVDVACEQFRRTLDDDYFLTLVNFVRLLEQSSSVLPRSLQTGNIGCLRRAYLEYAVDTL